MKEKLYSEMCSFLSDREPMLNEFRLFYDRNKDSDKFIELFDEEYGAMYEAFKGSVKYSVAQQQSKKEIIETDKLIADNDSESFSINNPATLPQETEENSVDVFAEKALTTISNVVLIIGIIGSLIMVFTITYTTIEGEYNWQDKTIVNPMGVVLTIATLISSVTVWGFLRVICNISISLKEINFKTK